MANVLIVDDEEGIREFIAEVLTEEGHQLSLAPDGLSAQKQLSKKRFHLMVTDLKMPKMSGMSLLQQAKQDDPQMEVIVLTAHGTVQSAVQAMKLGAFDYLTKPLSGPDELRLAIARALEHRHLRQMLHHQSLTRPKLEMIASDPASIAVVKQLEKVAATDTSVLITGESGTGKEVAAHSLHAHSPRAAHPFVAINCAALSDQLLESELFGHEKGAFTGAMSQKRGRFELADGGTLFLDEVAELKPHLQAKLLRAIQERAIERVGGSRTIEVDIRIVAATNRNLQQEMQAGRFREDLYHRLAVFPVHLQPLRERPGDIMPLVEHNLGLLREKLGRPDLRLDHDVVSKLTEYSWPGNVRELSNVLERAVILADGDIIRTEDLVMGPISQQPIWDGTLKDLEKEAIRKALASTQGHRKQAAQRLGIGLRTLYDKLKEYDLS